MTEQDGVSGLCILNFQPAAALHKLRMCFSFWADISGSCYARTETVAVQDTLICQHAVNFSLYCTADCKN